MGGLSKIIPKDYPTSPDIEDRREEPKVPEYTFQAETPKESDYRHARKWRPKKM